MNIQPATRSDLKECALILISAYSQPPWRQNWSISKATQYLTEYFDAQQFVGFVLCADERITGAVFAHKQTWWYNDQLYIDQLFISPQEQRKGYGKLLLAKVEKYSIENGVKGISLMTNHFMPSFDFYKKLGYVDAEQFVIMFREVG